MRRIWNFPLLLTQHIGTRPSKQQASPKDVSQYSIPVAVLFGPTEWWRNGSLRVDDICVDRNDIDCRVACHRRACSNWICMEISVERVLQATGERLKRVRRIPENVMPASSPTSVYLNQDSFCRTDGV